MPNIFFSNDIQREENRFLIGGDTARHLAAALRIKPGESLTVTWNPVRGPADPSRGPAAHGEVPAPSIDYTCVIRAVDRHQVCAEITAEHPNQSEPSVAVTLYQCLPKGDKFELILQKSVELGVTTIVPVVSSRCISRPDEKSLSKKLLRFQKIAHSAAEQSGRGMIPRVAPPLDFSAACLDASSAHLPLLCYEKGGLPLGELSFAAVTSIALLIGPEGGFSPSEVELAERHRIQIISLGPRILRCETAPLAALSILMHLTGNM